MKEIRFVEEQMLTKPNFPEFSVGDNIIVTYQIIEGDKRRNQSFKGDVIQIKGHSATKTFTIRKMSNGVGVERIFPFTNPNIVEIKVVKRGKIRRAKLYYLRALVGKKSRIKERRKK